MKFYKHRGDLVVTNEFTEGDHPFFTIAKYRRKLDILDIDENWYVAVQEGLIMRGPWIWRSAVSWDTMPRQIGDLTAISRLEVVVIWNLTEDRVIDAVCEAYSRTNRLKYKCFLKAEGVEILEDFDEVEIESSLGDSPSEDEEDLDDRLDDKGEII